MRSESLNPNIESNFEARLVPPTSKRPRLGEKPCRACFFPEKKPRRPLQIASG